MEIVEVGFDHVEFVVGSLDHHETLLRKLGFEKIGENSKQRVMGQGWIRILLSLPETSELNQKFHAKHGDGVSVLALMVDSVSEWIETTTARGAKPAQVLNRSQNGDFWVETAEIFTPEDIRYRFVKRNGLEFLSGLSVLKLESSSPNKLRVIDHLTNNVSIGEMDKWVEFYKKIFEFEVVRHFEISTGRTGLNSYVVQSKCGKIKVPINEATEPQSQVQEFVERFHGAGVQHLAFLTTDILHTVPALEKDFKFLTVPKTYYEAVPTRVKNFSEDLNVLAEHSILMDSEGEGYLLQIFTEETIGPFFYEFIQRKGNQGFGEGNFKALFEAIERDQVRRGVL